MGSRGSEHRALCVCTGYVSMKTIPRGSLREIIGLGVGDVDLFFLKPNPLMHPNWDIVLHEALKFLHLLQAEALITFSSRLSFQGCLCSEKP